MNNINNDVNNDLNKTIEALNHFVNIDDCDIEYLKDEAESAREEYEDKDELTDIQQEKYDRLDEFASTLEEVIDNVSLKQSTVSIQNTKENNMQSKRDFFIELEDIRLQVVRAIGRVVNDRVEGMTEEEKNFYSEQLEDMTATIDVILNNRFRIK